MLMTDTFLLAESEDKIITMEYHVGQMCEHGGEKGNEI